MNPWADTPVSLERKTQGWGQMKDEGGAAMKTNHTFTHVFPTGEETKIMQTEENLRDWFAGQAIQNAPNNAFEFGPNAAWAYKMADAMLAEREKVNHD